ncbi:hypothetical protein K1T71_006686 [Dendrolimus kikuchii]|uniref:Uncharacterized protein n=1 Tax=Dendrolimus kikuchii TaxID=765133 RepID=A0ACC1D1Q6_9NEOP|nr:hypothetical protein K1T71_006686 [Dendrolimus kikuchii]
MITWSSGGQQVTRTTIRKKMGNLCGCCGDDNTVNVVDQSQPNFGPPPGGPGVIDHGPHGHGGDGPMGR